MKGRTIRLIGSLMACEGSGKELFAERAQCRGRQLAITSPILAGEMAEVAETVHAGGSRYVSFGVVVAQGVTCCLQPQMAVERDGRLSSEALELPTQRALGRTGSGGDFASRERSGEVALHEADGHRNASRGRTAGPDRHFRASGRLLHWVFPRCRACSTLNRWAAYHCTLSSGSALRAAPVTEPRLVRPDAFPWTYSAVCHLN